MLRIERREFAYREAWRLGYALCEALAEGDGDGVREVLECTVHYGGA